MELEPTLMSYQQYRIAFSRKISVYSLNPFYYLDYYDKSTFHRIGLSWDWHFCQTQRIGLIYYMEGSKLNKAKLVKFRQIWNWDYEKAVFFIVFYSLLYWVPVSLLLRQKGIPQ